MSYSYYSKLKHDYVIVMILHVYVVSNTINSVHLYICNISVSVY